MKRLLLALLLLSPLQLLAATYNVESAPFPTTGPQPTQCELLGLTQPLTAPVVAAGNAVKCWWPGVTIAPGTYSFTAKSILSTGQKSTPSTPPLAFTAVDAPTPTGLTITIIISVP